MLFYTRLVHSRAHCDPALNRRATYTGVEEGNRGTGFPYWDGSLMVSLGGPMHGPSYE